MKYAPRKVYIKESGGYAVLSYTDFCRRRESDQTYMDKLFIPIQGCLLVKEIAVLSASDSGYTKEINLISWNGKEPKYDVRSFSPNREKCGKYE